MGRGDRRDDADLVAVGLEDDALLDVELDERVHGVGIDARVGQAVGLEARLAQRGRHARAGAVDEPVEVGALELAGRGAAADAARAEARLLAGPRDDVDRAPRDDARRAQGADRLDRPQHAQDSVVGAGVERRVDVRAGDDHRGVGLGAAPAAEEVAHGVQARLEARVAHPRGDPLQGGGVGRRVDLAGDAAGLGVVVEPRQLGDGVVQGAHGTQA